MELNEVARRIFRQHWLLIAGAVVLGIVVAVLHASGSSMYTANARLVLGTDDPKSRTESGSIADAGKAIATSPAQIRQALAKANVTDRDPTDVARHVSVSALGTSGVVQLSVTDKSPATAATIANALSERLIAVRQDVTSGQLQQLLADLGDRIDVLTSRIAATDLKIDNLSAEIARAGSTGSANALRAKRDQASQLRDLLAQQRSVVESERISVLSADALRPKAAIIGAATPPRQADASRLLQELVLGALLGLILGVGIAALIETLRPTLVGGDALARQFDTPLLGTLAADADEDRARRALAQTALRLRLAAGSAQVTNLGLLAVGPAADLGLLAATLDELAQYSEQDAQARLAAVGAVAGSRGPVVAAGSRDREQQARGAGIASSSRLRIHPFELSHESLDNRTAGLVLVSPSIAKKTEIEDVSHLLRLAHLPVLGLIAFERPRKKQSRLKGPFAR
jgi:capsular polysaccharide biosynthesis protein